MTTIDVDTSPLQAAREWRGIGRVAAALSSGLPVAQAEALEGGDTGAFDSVDEMIAAAVVYGASLGIGRDEAMALLDRTVTRNSDLSAQLPEVTDTELPAGGFSAAVRERSARITTRPDASIATPIPLPLSPFEPLHAPDVPATDEPPMPSQTAPALPDVPTGPTPEQAVEASHELHLGDPFQVDDEWHGSDNTGELEAWASEPGRSGGSSVVGVGTGLGARLADRTRSGMERVIGTDRSDAVADWTARTVDRVHELTRTGREKLRRSEHATLIVAIGAGAILIALLVAVGGALGGDDSTSAGPGPETSPAINAKQATDPAASTDAGADGDKAAVPPAAATPMVPISKLSVNVYNAGSKKGYAKEAAAKVGGFGYKVGTVGNAKSDYSAATIVYTPGLEREARVLGKKFGITRLQEAPGTAKQLTLVVT